MQPEKVMQPETVVHAASALGTERHPAPSSASRRPADADTRWRRAGGGSEVVWPVPARLAR